MKYLKLCLIDHPVTGNPKKTKKTLKFEQT